MKPITLHLGLDVHKDSITIAIAEPGSKGEIRLFGTITAAERAAPPATGDARWPLPPVATLAPRQAETNTSVKKSEHRELVWGTTFDDRRSSIAMLLKLWIAESHG